MLFECADINNIWSIVAPILGLDVSDIWRMIVLGSHKLTAFRESNLVVSNIGFIAYKKWLIDSAGETDVGPLRMFVKRELLFKFNIYGGMRRSPCVSCLESVAGAL